MTDTDTLTRSARFAAVWKATSARRLTGAVIADHTVDGTRHRLTLTAERVAIVTAAYRGFNADFAVEKVDARYGNISTEMTLVVRDAVQQAADVFGLRGKCDLRVNVPTGAHAAGDATTAAAAAAVDAFLSAAEVSQAPAQMREIAARTGLPHTVPGAAGFGVHDVTTGSYVTPIENFHRFGTLIVHRPGFSSSELTGVGSLPTGPAPQGAQEAAQWLADLNGPVQGPVAQYLSSLTDRPEVLGVVGGHTPTDPFVFLLAGDQKSLTEAQRLRGVAAAAIADKPDWAVTYVLAGMTR
jgi:hypothetical protein